MNLKNTIMGLSFWLLLTAAVDTTAPDPLNDLSRVAPEEDGKFMNFLKEHEKEFNSLSPERQEALEANVRLDLIRNNIHPDTFQSLSNQERNKLEPAALEEVQKAEAIVEAAEAKTTKKSTKYKKASKRSNCCKKKQNK